MKRFFDKEFWKTRRNKLREYWRSVMRSTHVNASEGAQEANKLHTFPQKDQWRRNDKKSK